MDLDIRPIVLGEEVLASVRLIQKGLAEVQSISGANDFYLPSMLLLSTGLERLMKCILCLREREAHGDFPSAKTIKHYSHDLERLRDDIVTMCCGADYRTSRSAADADATFLESDQRLRALLSALSRFARSARYHNLDVVGGADPETDSPEQEWAALEMEIVFERPDLLDALQRPGSSDRLFDEINREFVSRIEVLVRALCRLFTLGPLGDRSKEYTAYLGPFLDLRDDELGKCDYRMSAR